MLFHFVQHDFSSVKSDSDSDETIYDDVISATPKMGVSENDDDDDLLCLIYSTVTILMKPSTEPSVTRW